MKRKITIIIQDTDLEKGQCEILTDVEPKIEKGSEVVPTAALRLSHKAIGIIKILTENK